MYIVQPQSRCTISVNIVMSQTSFKNKNEKFFMVIHRRQQRKYTFINLRFINLTCKAMWLCFKKLNNFLEMNWIAEMVCIVFHFNPGSHWCILPSWTLHQLFPHVSFSVSISEFNMNSPLIISHGERPFISSIRQARWTGWWWKQNWWFCQDAHTRKEEF